MSSFSNPISAPAHKIVAHSSMLTKEKIQEHKGGQSLGWSILDNYLPSKATVKQSLMNQQAIRNACLNDYSKAVSQFESDIIDIAAKDPRAKKFAHEMLTRMASIARAYAELSYKGSSSPQMKELTLRLASAVEFSSTEKAPGGVGYNPLAIEKALKEGNLREQMTLLYHTVWTLLPQAFADPKLCAKLSERLDFKLNMQLIEQTREQAKKQAISDPVVVFFSRCETLEEFRNTNGRLNIQSSKPRVVRVKDVRNLSERELRNALCDPLANTQTLEKLAEHELPWESGDDFFAVNKESSFYKQALALGDLPLRTGPSGTAEGYLKAAAYLNMDGHQEGAMLALIGWMLPTNDHSLHEIREAGSWYQVPYEKGPRAFQEVYGADISGLKQPGDCLTPQHQLKVSKRLGLSQSSTQAGRSTPLKAEPSHIARPKQGVGHKLG